MDPNDPRLRLQALNQSNPSIRNTASPGRLREDQVRFMGTTPGIQNQDTQPAPKQPQQDTFHKILGFAHDAITEPFRPFAQGIVSTFTPATKNLQQQLDRSTAIDDQALHTFADLHRQGKIDNQKWLKILQDYGQSSQDINKEAQQIQDTADKSRFIGSAVQVAAAPFLGATETASTLTGKMALGALEGSGLGLANEFTSQKDPTLKGAAVNTGIGGVIGGILPAAGAAVKSIFKGSGTKLAESVAQETNPESIKASLGVDDELANYLAQEKDPKIIKSVLKEAGIDGKANQLKSSTEPPTKVSDVLENKTPTIFDENTNVPRSKATGVPDAISEPKITDLITRAESTPRTPGTIRVFQALEDGGKSSYVFDNVDSLDAFMSGKTTPTTDFTFHDVPTDQLVKGKAPGVYEVKGELPNPELNTAPVTPPTTTEAAITQAAPEQSGVTPTEVTPTGETAPAATQAAPVSDATAIGDNVAKTADTAAQPTQTSKDILPTDASPEAHKAVQDVLDSLNSAETNYADVTKVRAAEKASRAAQAEQAYQAAGGGEAGMRAKLAALRGKYSESGFTPIEAHPDAQKAILDDIANSNLRSFEKTNTQNAIRKVWGSIEAKPTPSDIKYIRDYFGQEFGDAVEQAVKEGGTAWREKVGQIAGLPKSIMASYDLSGTLRQGGVLASRFPKEAANAFKDEVRYFASEQAFKEGMAEIAARPTYEAMVNAKLGVEAAQGLTGTEEQFVSNLAEKIPGFGRGVAASDRAYSGFLTKLRADSFDNIVRSYEAAGKPLSEDAMKSVAKFINTASGKGDLGQYLEKHSTTLSTALFSPKLWKSRLDLLNPVFYAKLDGPARKLALQTAASFASEATAILSLASLAGAKVSTDLRSSDFGKIKVGNTRYDILGGLQQNLVFAWREISGQKVNSETGDVTDLTAGKFGSADRLSTLTDMIQNKENPLLAAGQRILQGHDRGGNKVNPLSELASLAVPLPVSGSVQTIQDTGSIPKGIAMNAPDLLGISSQTYGGVKSKDKGVDGTYKGKITPDMVTNPDGSVILDKNGAPIKATFPKGATDLQKQTILDNKRVSAMKDQYKRTLSNDDQGLVSLNDKQLENYVKAGKIDQAKMDHIQQVRQDMANLDGVEIPKGAKSNYAKDFYNTYNSMDVKDKKAYLEGPADKNAVEVTKYLNSKRSPGLSELKPSNKLAKAYSEFENDINTHPDYTNIDIRNKTKAFQTFAYKQNYDQHVNDIYSEGGSSDLKYLIDNKAISKADMDAAIKMDNELYASGLTGSLKFNSKFRDSMGYSTPSGSGSGKKATLDAHLSSLIPNIKAKGTPAPQFSARNRMIKGIKSANLPQSSGKSKKISIKL